MNNALTKYLHNKSVAAICGYAPKFLCNLKEETYFLKGIACWGWAVWKRSWSGFEYKSSFYWNELEKRNLTKLVTFNGKKYWFKEQKDIIDLQFKMYLVLNNMLVLYPTKSLIRSIGQDGTGINTPKSNKHKTFLYTKPIKLKDIEVIENKKVHKLFYYFFSKQYYRHKFILFIKSCFKLLKL